MSPTDQERLATLEAKQEGMKEQLTRVEKMLEKMPAKISRNTRKHIERCREKQAQTCAVLKSSPPAKQPDDYSWLRKLLVVGLSVGTLIGGAIYGFTQEGDVSKNSALKQGVKP